MKTSLVSWSLGLGLGLVLTFARNGSAAEEEPVAADDPPQEEAPSSGGSPHWGLVIGGSVTWGVSYVAGVIATAVVSSQTGGNVPLSTGIAAIPLVGPWIGFPVAQATDGNLTPPMIGGIIAVGLTQAAGFSMLIAGLCIRDRPDPGAASVQVVPTFDAKNGAGLSAVGTF
jgi:hypothetical protein